MNSTPLPSKSVANGIDTQFFLTSPKGKIYKSLSVRTIRLIATTTAHATAQKILQRLKLQVGIERFSSPIVEYGLAA